MVLIGLLKNQQGKDAALKLQDSVRKCLFAFSFVCSRL
jgi:hypothetical protein